MNMRNILPVIAGCMVCIMSFCKAVYASNEPSMINSNINVVDTALDAYIEDSGTYMIHASHLYNMLLSDAPYSRRLKINTASVDDETYNQYCAEAINLLQNDYNISDPIIVNNTKQIYERADIDSVKIDKNGVSNRINICFVQSGTSLSQSIFSNGGFGVATSCDYDVNILSTKKQFDTYYGDIKSIEGWEYNFENDDDLMIEISDKEYEMMRSGTGVVSFDGKYNVTDGINIIKFESPTMFGKNLTWYEIYVGVDNVVASNTKTSLPIFLLVIIACVISISACIYARHHMSDYSKNKNCRGDVVIETVHTEQQFDINDEDIIDVKFREIN